MTHDEDGLTLKPEPILTKKGKPTSLPAWVPCQSCDDFWCTIHYKHVYDCECPGIEAWEDGPCYPYDEGGRSPWPPEQPVVDARTG